MISSCRFHLLVDPKLTKQLVHWHYLVSHGHIHKQRKIITVSVNPANMVEQRRAIESCRT